MHFPVNSTFHICMAGWYSIVYIHHTFFLHLSVGGDLASAIAWLLGIVVLSTPFTYAKVFLKICES
jgi:hypothetical protein